MKDNFIFHTEYMEQIELLNMEQRGVLLTALICYQSQEDLPVMDAETRMCFAFIKARINKENEAYEEKCRKNAENGSLGGRPKKADGIKKNRTVLKETERFIEKPKKADIDIDNDIDNKEKVLPNGNTKKKAPQKFIPPTVEEVKNYANEKGYVNFSADRFCDFYESNGWMVGRNKMKDWKAAVRGWNARDRLDNKKSHATKFSNFEQRTDSLDELMRKGLL